MGQYQASSIHINGVSKGVSILILHLYGERKEKNKEIMAKNFLTMIKTINPNTQVQQTTCQFFQNKTD